MSQGNSWAIYVNDNPISEVKLFKSLTISNYKEKLKESVLSQINKGYLMAGIDSVVKMDSIKELDIYYDEGELYKWANLKVNQKDNNLLSELGYGEKLYNNKPFSPRQLANLFESTLIHLENRGYPFSSLKLDSVEFLENSITAELRLEKGPEIIIDTIYIKTNEKIEIKTVYNFIKLKPGDQYNEQTLSEIAVRIKEIPYWNEVKPVELEFVNNKCNVYVYLKSSKSNNFNGVLGLQPDQNGKIGLTGDVKVKLLNSFFKGEMISFNWRKTQQLTQDLDIAFNYPFLFNTPFGIDTKASIYKKDTSFVDADFNIGVDYIFSGLNKITLFYENKNASLLSTKKYESVTTLPDFADITKNNYGVKLEAEKLDYRFNPRKGFSINVLGSVGFKKIKRNQALPQNLYDDLKLNTFVYNSEGIVRWFIPIRKRSTILLKLRGATFYNENIFTNELFRLGGVNTIRGFDEESIFASSYLISSLEYRFILEQNSNIYLFYDYGLLERNSREEYLADKPFSFGAGISFETKPGIFSLSYALGSQFNAPIYLRTAKVHFGFTSFF